MNKSKKMQIDKDATKRINKLTKEQEAQIPAYIEKWVGKACGKTDRSAATKAVKDMYQAMGESEPIVMFGQSPISTDYLSVMFCRLVEPSGVTPEKISLHDQLRDMLDNQLRGELGNLLGGELSRKLSNEFHQQLNEQSNGQLNEQINEQIREKIRLPLTNQLRYPLEGSGIKLDKQLRRQVSREIYEKLREKLLQEITTKINRQLYDQLSRQLYKQLNINNMLQLPDWYRIEYHIIWYLRTSLLYDFAQYIGVKFDKKAYELYISFVENVSFIIPYKGIAFVSDKPTKIVWDGDRLSFYHDRAVQYADGWGIYSLDGVNLEKEEWGKTVNQQWALKKEQNYE